MKGRKPKPDTTRRRRNARPSLPYDPERAKAIDAPPKWLSREAREEWNRVVGELQEEGAATNWDRSLLVAYCIQWDRFQKATRQIQKYGSTQCGEDDVERPSAWVAIQQGAFDRMMKAAEKLRLTPIDRARTPIAKPKPKAPMSSLPQQPPGHKKAVGEDPRRLLQMVPKQ